MHKWLSDQRKTENKYSAIQLFIYHSKQKGELTSSINDM